MFDGLFMLLVLSVIMCLSCFLAGAIPLSMALSPSQLRLISTIGMGVLVGTSLVVIIPEGIEAVYTAGSSAHAHGARSIAIQERTSELSWVGGVNTIAYSNKAVINRRRPHLNPRTSQPMEVEIITRESLAEEKENGAPEKSEEKPAGESDVHHDEDESPTFWIGLSLILGFILMFLIDKVPRHASEKLQAPVAPRQISLNNLSQGISNISSSDEESDGFFQSLTPSPKQSRSLATTTGLVIHASADGIAMGASASTSNTKLGFIIFIAIMVHKAPAAFGLTSVLLKQGLSKRAARGHLIVFSLAAPFGAITTFLLVNILGGGNIEGAKGQWWTGMLLLFSGGTFLYVAMHAMQEDSGVHSHEHTNSNGYLDGISQRKQAKPQMRDTLAAVGGMLIPLLTQFGHDH
ncbi:similar to ZIP metal ion transporter [Botrytis cinerea T4]|uniref:Similar to ZIP metal ion transporter n=2 Tax=Botryotinia fuckeliana TaxID=40559 RepID=G2Y0N0_BOTF4|nr:similar to ZIP metal ion transporter [Botrytis cinerea T4]